MDEKKLRFLYNSPISYKNVYFHIKTFEKSSKNQLLVWTRKNMDEEFFSFLVKFSPVALFL